MRTVTGPGRGQTCHLSGAAYITLKFYIKKTLKVNSDILFCPFLSQFQNEGCYV